MTGPQLELELEPRWHFLKKLLRNEQVTVWMHSASNFLGNFMIKSKPMQTKYLTDLITPWYVVPSFGQRTLTIVPTGRSRDEELICSRNFHALYNLQLTCRVSRHHFILMKTWLTRHALQSNNNQLFLSCVNCCCTGWSNPTGTCTRVRRMIERNYVIP